MIPLAPLLALMISSSLNAVPVKIVHQGGQYELLRDGKPYAVHGVGLGSGHIDLFLKYGGNSVRTWGAEQLQDLLPVAKAKGFTVCAGIWIQHCDEFDYNDADKVEQQKQATLAVIRKYKDDPQILMWGIGNEAHGFGEKYNPKVYQAINDIVKEGKKIDPNHPFITVNADLSRGDDLIKYCTDVDAIGFNSYGGAFSIVDRYKKAGGTKPILLTEFGPLGQWEIGKTSWGAAPEMSSTAKGELYQKVYDEVAKNKGFVLGTYAFLWGNKQETTATWFGMVTPDGHPLAAAQAASEFWTGKKPADLCPVVKSMTVNQDIVKPGSTVVVKLDASDPEGQPLTVKWTVAEETEKYGVGGKDEDKPADLTHAIVSSDNGTCTVRVPNKAAGYRIFAVITDPGGAAANANVCILAKP